MPGMNRRGLPPATLQRDGRAARAPVHGGRSRPQGSREFPNFTVRAASIRRGLAETLLHPL
jgi:hypothetical protein